MKMKFIFLSITVILFSCGSSETAPELTPEEQELANKRQENANRTNFNLGMADYQFYKNAYTNELVTYEELDKAEKGATDKFELIINDAPESQYADSAKIYLDSLNHYVKLYNDGVSKSLQESLGN